MQPKTMKRSAAAAATVDGPSKPQPTYNKYVTKYKRTKNLVKKCVDISDQCNVDMILIIHDRNTKRCREYHTSLDLTATALVDKLKSNDKKLTQRYEKIWTGAKSNLDD